MEERRRLIDQMSAYDSAIQHYKDIQTHEAQVKLANTFVCKGYALWKLDRNDEAMDTLTEVVERFGQASEPDLRENVVRALNYKAQSFAERGLDDEAQAAFDDLLARLEGALTKQLRVERAFGLFEKAHALRVAGRLEDAWLVLADLINPFNDQPPDDDDILEWVVDGMFLAAGIARDLGQPEPAIILCDELLKRYGEVTLIFVRLVIAEALALKTGLLADAGDTADAVELCDLRLRRLDDSREDEFRPFVAEALFDRGHLLHQLGRNADALEDYRAVLDRFAADEDPGTSERIGLAREAVAELSR